MDIEEIIIKYLSEQLSGVAVAASVPNPRPSSMVSVERVGGGFDSIVLDRPRIAVQCWADTRVKAAELAYKVDDAIRKMDNPAVPHIERTDLYNFPAEDGSPRYQVVLEATVYL